MFARARRAQGKHYGVFVVSLCFNLCGPNEVLPTTPTTSSTSGMRGTKTTSVFPSPRSTVPVSFRWLSQGRALPRNTVLDVVLTGPSARRGVQSQKCSRKCTSREGRWREGTENKIYIAGRCGMGARGGVGARVASGIHVSWSGQSLRFPFGWPLGWPLGRPSGQNAGRP